jgi:hypothetical protein
MKTLIAAILVALSFPASAQLYGHIGAASIDGGSGIALGAGYRFTPSLSLEGAYFDPGAESSGPNPIVRQELSSLSVMGLATLPVGRLELGAMAGAHYLRGEYESRTLINSGTPDIVSSGGGAGWAPALGVVAQLKLLPNVAVRAAVQRLQAPSGLFGAGRDPGDLTLKTIGLRLLLD